MLNLLPKKNKEINRKEYYFRVIILSLTFLFLTFILSFIYFLPSYFYSNFKKNELFQRLNDPKKETLIKEGASLGKFLELENLKMMVLKEGVLDRDFNDLFKKVIDRRSKGVFIESFSYDKQDMGIFLTIRGVADTRDQLVDFTKNIEKENSFIKVDLPVSNLVKDKKVDFLIKITLNP